MGGAFALTLLLIGVCHLAGAALAFGLGQPRKAARCLSMSAQRHAVTVVE